MDLNAIEIWDIDGTNHQVGLRNIYVNEKGNLVIETTAEMGNTSKGTINIESMKNIQLKPGGKGDIRFMTDHTDNLGQATLHVYDGSKTVPGSKDDIPARLKLNITDLEIDTKGSLDRVSGAKVAADGTEISVKNSGTYVKARWKAASHDIRAYSSGDGTGGGIAVQIAGRDSGLHENKFKIETDRIVDVDADAAAEHFCGEGGKGVEIGTVNSQMTSFYTKTYRFKGDAPIYGVTRGELVTSETGKVDYPTQADDSKDIINDSAPITWNDVIKAVKYLKAQGSI